MVPAEMGERLDCAYRIGKKKKKVDCYEEKDCKKKEEEDRKEEPRRLDKSVVRIGVVNEPNRLQLNGSEDRRWD